MSYNGSGTFVINSTGQPVVSGTVISSTAFNALTADLGTGLSTALTKDGQTTATARIPFAQGISSTLVTDASSTTTGSIITAGGVGIAKALYVGTLANFAGAATFSSTINKVTVTAPATSATLTIADGASLVTSGAYSLTLTSTAATNVTLPTTGTLATLAGSEALTNKTLTNPTVTNYVETLYAIGNSSTAVTIALTNGTVQTVTMTGNCTFTMPTATAGKSFILICTQDGTGSRTAVFTSVKFPGGTAPTLTTTATTGVDILTFVSNGTSWFGTAAQAFA